MSSLKERSKTLDRLVIDAGECQEVVLEIKYNGITVSEKIIAVNQLNWQPSTGKNDVVVSFREVE
jgi:hypothetical protein